MTSYVAHIEGMACPMCEAHVQEAIRKALPGAKKVAASHKNATATFETEEPVDQAALSAAVNATGYTFVSLDTAQPKKHFWQR